MSATANVCTRTVADDLCAGCGVCAGICPSGNLVMAWNELGEYQPVAQGRCRDQCNLCLQVCPFQDHDENESTLSSARFGANEGICHRPEIGYCVSSYVGHVAEGDFRQRGASGGVATWLLVELLARGMADRVATVVPSANPERLFTFALLSKPCEVRTAAKSRYYPVELSAIIQEVLSEEGRYAVAGVPCALKAVSLAMGVDGRLRKRVKFLVGLACGQMKSRAFTEYLVRLLGLSPTDVRAVDFRGKQPSGPATDFVFRVDDGGSVRSLARSGEYGRAWTTGQFKLRSCTFCDDMFTEVADVAVMDAWLPPYMYDSRGTSIALVRSNLVDRIIRNGVTEGRLALSRISVDQVLASQRSTLYTKRELLAQRLWLSERDGLPHPRTRVLAVRPSWRQASLRRAEEAVRLSSHVAMREQRAVTAGGLGIYDSWMAPVLRRFRAMQLINNPRGGVRALAGRGAQLLRRRRGTAELPGEMDPASGEEGKA